MNIDSPQLIELINSRVEKMRRDTIIFTILVLINTCVVFKICDLSNFFLCEGISVSAFTGMLLYALIIPDLKIIKTTPISVTSTEDGLSLNTMSVKIFFFNQPSVTMPFKRGEFKVHKVYYPVKFIYDLDKLVFKLSSKDADAYIVDDYFNNEVAVLIENMK